MSLALWGGSPAIAEAAPSTAPGNGSGMVLTPAEAAIVQTVDILWEIDSCLVPVKDRETADAAVPAFLASCRKLHKVLVSLDEMEEPSQEETERICSRHEGKLKVLSESCSRKLAALRQADYYGSEALKEAVESFMEELKGAFPSMG